MKYRVVKYILEYAMYLMLLLSIIAICFSFYEAYNYSFDLSKEGFITFLEIFELYKYLFSGTFVGIAAYLTVVRIELSIKDAHKSMWFTILKESLDIMMNEGSNTYIPRYIIIRANKIYNFVSDMNFQFEKKSQLIKFFDEFELNEDTIALFEKHDESYKFFTQRYPNRPYAHSEYNFLLALMSIATSSKRYQDFLKDFQDLYRENVKMDKVDGTHHDSLFPT